MRQSAAAADAPADLGKRRHWSLPSMHRQAAEAPDVGDRLRWIAHAACLHHSFVVVAGSTGTGGKMRLPVCLGSRVCRQVAVAGVSRYGPGARCPEGADEPSVQDMSDQNGHIGFREQCLSPAGADAGPGRWPACGCASELHVQLFQVPPDRVFQSVCNRWAISAVCVRPVPVPGAVRVRAG